MKEESLLELTITQILSNIHNSQGRLWIVSYHENFLKAEAHSPSAFVSGEKMQSLVVDSISAGISDSTTHWKQALINRKHCSLAAISVIGQKKDATFKKEKISCFELLQEGFGQKFRSEQSHAGH